MPGAPMDQMADLARGEPVLFHEKIEPFATAFGIIHQDPDAYYLSGTGSLGFVPAIRKGL